jgi:CheY-like chemotaxis protein
MDQHRGARVLVVEDEADYREIVREFLESAGYQVSVVGDVAAARAAIRARRPDLAVLDLQLPDGSGFDVAAELVGDGGALVIPVIACSGDADSLARARRDGRFAVVYAKPCSLTDLVEAVGRTLGGGTATSPVA